MKTKINLSMMILTSLICLLPLIQSLLVYTNLPDQIGIPFWGLNSEGNYNRYSHKAAIAFFPLNVFVINFIYRIILSRNSVWDKAPNAIRIILDWFIPFISLFYVPIILFMAMGVEIPAMKILLIIAGIIYIIYGNYVPKLRQKNIDEIKLLKTLKDPDNWNKTHRIQGYFYLCGGFILVIVSFLPLEQPVLFGLLLSISIIIITVPYLYSILVYLKTKNDNKIEA